MGNLAQKLRNISSRYEPQVKKAEQSLRKSISSRDNTLRSYYDKILMMTKYPPKQINDSLSILNINDPSQREKIVITLLANHIETLRNDPHIKSNTLLVSYVNLF